MLGWEFPPYFAGGVGTVCYELTRGLAKQGVDVAYVMPHGPEQLDSTHVRLLVADRSVLRLGMGSIKALPVDSTLAPYLSSEEYGWQQSWRRLVLPGVHGAQIYGGNLLDEMHRFAAAVLRIGALEQFDVIHAHDWTTIPAAIALKRATGKPLVIHVHITDFDKTGGEHADPAVYRIEHEGFQQADMLIAVSNMVRNRLIERYYVPPGKIKVIHNAIDGTMTMDMRKERIGEHEKIVLFLGRVTLQKGPDYFLEAAAKAAAIMPDVKFVIAGTGDMLPRLVERAAQLGIGNRVIFTGFVTREQGDELYRMADLFVMPSVSEPFGIVPLEAIKQGTPVIISKQSGVSEVLRHALKVDFWDVEELASKIVAALSYRELRSELREHGAREVQGLTWESPAIQCRHLYEQLIGRRAAGAW